MLIALNFNNHIMNVLQKLLTEFTHWKITNHTHLVEKLDLIDKKKYPNQEDIISSLRHCSSKISNLLYLNTLTKTKAYSIEDDDFNSFLYCVAKVIMNNPISEMNLLLWNYVNTIDNTSISSSLFIEGFFKEINFPGSITNASKTKYLTLRDLKNIAFKTCINYDESVFDTIVDNIKNKRKLFTPVIKKDNNTYTILSGEMEYVIALFFGYNLPPIIFECNKNIEEVIDDLPCEVKNVVIKRLLKIDDNI